MSDASVAAALRSTAPLVVIEAPAGTGKTYQGAQYASEASGTLARGRILILTHTHAACDVFSARTEMASRRVEICTIDGLIGQIAGAYHLSLGLPSDVGAWARGRKDGYAEVANKVASLLAAAPMVGFSLADRYPVVICDEHQDASAAQHEIIMAFHTAGSHLRIFADPMQRVFGGKSPAAILADDQRWRDLKAAADRYEQLDEPHRWADGSPSLGRWILRVRSTLRDGGKIDLRNDVPDGLTVLTAENRSPKQRGGFQLDREEGRPIHGIATKAHSLLVLAAYNDTVSSLHSLFGRRIPIWEGHVREGLAKLVDATHAHAGHPSKIARAALTFINHVATGFSPSAFGNSLLAEIDSGCTSTRRGKPATLQGLGRLILSDPTHRGVAKMLGQMEQLIATDPAFSDVRLNRRREFWDAISLGAFDDPHDGFGQIAHRRSHVRPRLAPRAISTVHKAKGLESQNVLLIPLDASHFAESPNARALLYVALSRATHSLTIVVSRADQSPLIEF